MRAGAEEEAVLSREELDALLDEMPKVLDEAASNELAASARVAELDLQRANEQFASNHGTMLSNRHQRVVAISLIGQRMIEMPELAELMLPTDLAARIEISPTGQQGFLLLSRPLFFQLLSMSFGSGPTIKPTRPPTRDYTRIERRFYERATRELVTGLEGAWKTLGAIAVEWQGLVGRFNVSESRNQSAVLASFDVRGFGEACRVRIAIPAEAFPADELPAETPDPSMSTAKGLSVDEVPMRLRARIGVADLRLAEVGRLKIGDVIPLDASADGALSIVIGGQEKFRGIAGAKGSKRAVQVTERCDGAR